MATNSIHLPEAGLLRIKQIIGDPKAEPPIEAIIPVSRSTWWAGVKSADFQLLSNLDRGSRHGVSMTFAR